MVKGTVGIVQTNYNSVANIMHIWEWFIAGHTKQSITKQYQWPLLLTWFNFNPSMDK